MAQDKIMRISDGREATLEALPEPPPGAAGYPDRSPDLDALPGVPATAETIPADTLFLDGLWDSELVPTKDNRWGGFRLPSCLPGSAATTVPISTVSHSTSLITLRSGWISASGIIPGITAELPSRDPSGSKPARAKSTPAIGLRWEYCATIPEVSGADERSISRPGRLKAASCSTSARS